MHNFLLIHQIDIDATGYETTANLWIYSCIMLAIREDIQEAVFEEVHTIYALLQQDSDHVNELSFSAHYPKFRYLVGFMVSVSLMFRVLIITDAAVTSMK